jgi:phospholipase C
MRLPGGFKHLVVIYEENHSFDNLYGTWGKVHGQQVDGLRSASPSNTVQVAQDGSAYDCLLQSDVNLETPPLANLCQDPEHGVPASRFTNKPFRIDNWIGPDDKTCPPPGVSAEEGVPEGSDGALPGGCTRDLVHRFYQEQYQIDGGKQDRYVTGSNAVGLTMGHYATRRLPIWRYLHSDAAPKYVVADRFFQAAFGGSFLNHQWLIAARTPYDASKGALGAQHSLLDANGMVAAYPLFTPTTGNVVDGQLTQECAVATENHYRQACGDFAVNTVQPANPPAGSGSQIALIDDARFPNIGDRMSAAGISWKWYSGGWDDAVAGNPGPLFQFHHQPFNYFANYAPGQPGRRHLQDETDFFAAAHSGHLPKVSFVKPYGAENEHPGYASEPNGSDHLVRLLEAVTSGPQADSTLVVVTYDEFGGQWDHVSPPGMGTKGVHDAWGPGTRIPALLVSRAFRHNGVDHRVYDTTSILATIERSYGLEPLGSRDARVHSLGHAVEVAGGRR